METSSLRAIEAMGIGGSVISWTGPLLMMLGLVPSLMQMPTLVSLIYQITVLALFLVGILKLPGKFLSSSSTFGQTMRISFPWWKGCRK